MSSQKESQATQRTVAVAGSPSRPCQEGGQDIPDNVEPLEREVSKEQHNVKKRGITSLNPGAHREDTTADGLEKKDEACVPCDRAVTDVSAQSKRHKVDEVTDVNASTDASDSTPALDAEKQTRDSSLVMSGQQLAATAGQQLCSAQSKQFDGARSVQKEGSCCAKAEPETVYQNAWILAPMVRISTLPFRLESLKYGAGSQCGSAGLLRGLSV
ncbi:hypothetical protein Emag_004531 [Eimeria magna]